jgi:nitrite reductase (NADH) large subunit
LLARSLEARGIAVRLNARTQAITGDGRAEAVQLEDGARLAADLVVMAVGIRPNAELAAQARLQCQRGVVVTDTLQTSDPRIYAVGECVAHRGVSYGLVAPLYDMSRVCANHLAQSGFRSYRGSVPATRLKVTGIDVFSAGQFMEAAGAETLVFRDGPNGVYRKLVVQDGRLTGAVLFGDAAHSTRYLELIESRAPVHALRDRLMFDPDGTLGAAA